MESIDRIFQGVLGDVVFGHGGITWSTLSATNFTCRSKDGFPELSFDFGFCHFGKMKIVWPNEPVKNASISILLRDPRDHGRDLITAVCGCNNDLREINSIGNKIDYVLEAYGYDRESLFESFVRDGSMPPPSQNLSRIQKFIVNTYLAQDAPRSQLLEELGRAEETPAALIDAARTQAEHLISNPKIAAPSPDATYQLLPDHGVPAKPLVEVFERELGWNVFGDEEKQLRITNIVQTSGSDAEGYLHPAVRFDAEIRENDSVEKYEAVTVTLGEDRYGDGLAVESDQSNKVPKEFAINIDEILGAYGFSREQFFANSNGELIGEVPKFILDALEQYDVSAEEPEWESEEDRNLWQKTLEEIKAKTGTEDYVISYAFKSGFDSYYGDTYSVYCAVPNAVTKDVDFKPSEELTFEQQVVLDQFFDQNMKPEQIPLLILTDLGHTPANLAKEAYGRFEKQLAEQVAERSDRKTSMKR